eukprot:2414729-Pyramimonas_sp.AAC.1
MACFHRYTAPNLKDFRVVRVRGWRRVFAHCAPIFFERVSQVITKPCRVSVGTETILFEASLIPTPAPRHRTARHAGDVQSLYREVRRRKFHCHYVRNSYGRLPCP